MEVKTMALNWLEEVVSQYYKLRGYIVLENEDLPNPEGVAGRGEADIIAFKDRELVHVECMSYWWGSRHKNEEFQKLNNKFVRVQAHIFEKYNFLQQYEPINKIFVVGGKADNPRPNGPWNRLQDFCGKEAIELIEVNTIVEDLIGKLREKYPKHKRLVGKEEGIARFLLHLIQSDFLKRPQE